jgi:hypothetical protein
VTRVTVALAQFLDEQLTLLSAQPFEVTRVTCVTCVTCVTVAWVTQSRLVDALVMPAGDVPVFLAIGLVLSEQTLLNEFVNPAHHRRHGGVVVARKDFGFEGTDAGRMVAAVVTEIP